MNAILSEINRRPRTWAGVGLAPGCGKGRVFLYGAEEVGESVSPHAIEAGRVEEEICRFVRAVEKAVRELTALGERARVAIGGTEAEIFYAHAALLQDSCFSNQCKQRISCERMNVERAVELSVGDMEKLFLDAKSDYMRERAQDIRDVGQRVLRHLAREGGRNTTSSLSSLPDRAIVVARELMPSDALELDRSHVAGIVTERGGVSSHTAILARALGVPSVMCVNGFLKAVRPGDWLLVDGGKGAVSIIAPETGAGGSAGAKRRRGGRAVPVADGAPQKCVTPDGVEIMLYGNLARVKDAGDVAAFHLDGAGLVRTEFLFLTANQRPDCETHVAAYRAIARAAGDRPVVIRTLDFGGDKRPSFLSSESEPRLAAGLRGLRFSLSEHQLLSVQLRGIVRAGAGADIRVLFPMVLGAEDLDEALCLLRDVAREEGVPVPPVGAMIETPAAVFELDEIIKRVDFVSIGTNDLTQFILAADRESDGMLDARSFFHPAVLKAVKRILATARENGKMASVCGEAAGAPSTAALLVGMGARHLSMSPLLAGHVRGLLGRFRCSELESLADRVMSAPTIVGAEQLLCQTLRIR